jgi:hypothetical protein
MRRKNQSFRRQSSVARRAPTNHFRRADRRARVQGRHESLDPSLVGFARHYGVPFAVVCAAGRQQGETLQTLVVGKKGEHLLFELRPGAAGDDGDLDDSEQPAEEPDHLGIEGRFAFRERVVEIEYNKIFHNRVRNDEAPRVQMTSRN